MLYIKIDCEKKRDNVMRKSNIILGALIVSLFITNPANADFKEHFDLGQQYLSNFQYSGAIAEFKNAMRINYLDNSARIGLINAYCARAQYYADKEQNYKKAADDFRSALFYLVYYPNANAVKNSSSAIVQVTANLNSCLSAINFDTSPSNRFNTAKQLRADGEFAAAAYEFNQSLGDKNYIKDSFEQTGDIMKLLGNDQKAAEYYRKAVAVAPDDIDLRMSYAKILDKLGASDTAVEEYNYVLARTTDNKDILYSLERIYKKKLEESPNDATVTSNLGAIMQKQGNFDEALRYYSKAEYLDPSNVNTRINVGTLYQQKGDYKTAITAYDSVLVLYPDNTQALVNKAQSLASLGDKQQALKIYKKVIALEPDNRLAQAQMMDIVRETMTPQQFVEYIKKNNSGGSAFDILYNYALELHRQNKLDDSIAIYNEVLNINSNNPEVYVNLAIAQSQQQKYNEAITTLNSANSKFPNNPQVKDALKNLTAEATNKKLETAANFYNNKDYQNAINEYLKIQPPTADVMLGIASSYQNLNDNSKAIEYYKKALQLKPNDSDIAYYIAALAADSQNWNEAKTYNDKALALNSNNQQALELNKAIQQQNIANSLEKAISMFEAQDYTNSLNILNQIISSDAQNSYALYYRGMIYDAQKKYKEAINDYQKALAANPELTIVNYLIGIDYDSLEQYKNAINYYQIFISKYQEDDDYKKYAQTRIAELSKYAQQSSTPNTK